MTGSHGIITHRLLLDTYEFPFIYKKGIYIYICIRMHVYRGGPRRTFDFSLSYFSLYSFQHSHAMKEIFLVSSHAYTSSYFSGRNSRATTGTSRLRKKSFRLYFHALYNCIRSTMSLLNIFSIHNSIQFEIKFLLIKLRY